MREPGCVGPQLLQRVQAAPGLTALALSPNALAFAALAPCDSGGCSLRIALLPDSACGRLAARTDGGSAEEAVAARAGLLGDRCGPKQRLVFP